MSDKLYYVPSENPEKNYKFLMLLYAITLEPITCIWWIPLGDEPDAVIDGKSISGIEELRKYADEFYPDRDRKYELRQYPGRG